MKICLPVDQLNGLESEIAPNFRAAPVLLIVDSETGECIGVDASKGSCGALPESIDAIVFADGVGGGMFRRLRQGGTRFFSSDARTVGEALAELAAGRLSEVEEVGCCGGGHHGGADADAGQAGCHGHQHEHQNRHAHGHGSCGCGHA
ncbi:NifB/NifX family molybdenum-iron cluster-binding protein [Rhodocyclus purpureus]|uniref:NifB/NifX family molybdenum-iron cluster-binding protein n=1 Tax=Rhodocyclus purpureus TaxID=1067 RepID=UPI001912A3B3|nr:NifB/NifX family molybdenum-iron cluster-binding protein [Rhodocyclus purpureus]MBK5914024.1 hypothetical protein [Rhodocyclus purpureus]